MNHEAPGPVQRVVERDLDEQAGVGRPCPGAGARCPGARRELDAAWALERGPA